MYYDRLFVKPAIWLRIARPVCDGRPFASSPFLRLASRGSPFRGVPEWWLIQLAIYLARCLTLHDPVLCCRESAQTQCSRPYDTLSCFFHTALWPGQCKSILTQTQHRAELDKACNRIFPFASITCSQAGPMSCPLSGPWLQQEDSISLVFGCRGKMQMMNILKTLISLLHIYPGDAMLFNRQRYSESG